METLWIALRPDTAVNTAQVESDVCLKDLADRFDAIKFSSRASVQELQALEMSILRTRNFVDYVSAQTPNLYEVRDAPLLAS